MSKEKQTLEKINDIVLKAISTEMKQCDIFEYSFRKEKEGLFNYVFETPKPFLNIYIDFRCKEVIIWRAPNELTDEIKKLIPINSGVKLILK